MSVSYSVELDHGVSMQLSTSGGKLQLFLTVDPDVSGIDDPTQPGKVVYPIELNAGEAITFSGLFQAMTEQLYEID